MSADRCAISWTRQQNIKSDKSYELNTYHFDFDFYRVRRWQWDASPPTCSCRHLCCRPNRQSFALKYSDRIRKIVEFVRLSLCFRLPSNRWPILYPFFFVFVVFSLWAFEHFAAIAFPPVFFVYFFCLRGKSLYFQIVRSVSQWSGIHLLIQIKKKLQKRTLSTSLGVASIVCLSVRAYCIFFHVHAQMLVVVLSVCFRLFFLRSIQFTFEYAFSFRVQRRHRRVSVYTHTCQSSNCVCVSVSLVRTLPSSHLRCSTRNRQSAQTPATRTHIWHVVVVGVVDSFRFWLIRFRT